MIKIICIGSIKEKYLKDAIEEYTKRLNKYDKVEIIELKDEGKVEEFKSIEIEADKILKQIKEKEFILTLEVEGKEITSPELANKISKTFIEHNTITFIIGGSYGLSDRIKNISNFHLSFSKMTFPHQLFRVILLEQIYRAYKINNNERYHK